MFGIEYREALLIALKFNLPKNQHAKFQGIRTITYFMLKKYYVKIYSKKIAFQKYTMFFNYFLLQRTQNNIFFILLKHLYVEIKQIF